MNWYRINKIAQNQPSLWDLSESWHEDVDYLDELNLSLPQMLQLHGVPYEIKNLNGHKLLIIQDDEMHVAESWDEQYPVIKTAQEWIDSLYDYELDKFMPMPESDFWDSPDTLYHATKENRHMTEEEVIQSIKTHGLMPKNDSRGISNRSMGAAIFTSTTSEGTDSYGNILVEIDTEQMKEDGYNNKNMPVTGEAPLDEAKQRQALASAIDFENYIAEDYTWEGYANDTIALYNAIPPKYLTIYDSDGVVV
jgi:hypothetical protein